MLATSNLYAGPHDRCRHCNSRLRSFPIDHSKDAGRRPLFKHRAGVLGPLGLANPPADPMTAFQAVVCPVCDGPDLKGKSNPPKKWLEGDKK